MSNQDNLNSNGNNDKNEWVAVKPTPSQNDKKDKRGNTVTKVIIGILIIIILALLFTMCNRQKNNGLEMDSTISEIKPGMSDDEIRAILNKKVEEGMINISMNLNPVFEDGTSKGNLTIRNEDVNNYPQMVYIVIEETGEEIYRSKGIPVGSEITEDKLSVDLDAGTYNCIAYFNNMDVETGNVLGTAAANVRLTVLN